QCSITMRNRHRGGDRHMGKLTFGLWDSFGVHEMSRSAVAADIYEQHNPTASFNSLSNVLVRKGVVTSRSWLTEDTLRWSWDPTSFVSSGAGTFGGETEV